MDDHDETAWLADGQLVTELLLARWRHLDDDQRWRAAVLADRVHQRLPLGDEDRRWLAATITRSRS